MPNKFNNIRKLKMETYVNSLGTSTTTYRNSVYDRAEVTFIPQNFYCQFTERMLWKALEKDMSKQLMNAYDKLFNDAMKLEAKLLSVKMHILEAITELKKHYKRCGYLYTITVIINGYIK